ncbi:MAG: phosphoglucosamine mutase [Thermoprotei archaeon]|nr:MAG: phosphoglucosamine mutase [Thermoprotei archaeon]
MTRKLFGTDGVRGVINVELVPETALRLSLAVGTYFNSGSKILIGRDCRAGSELIANAVIAGLLSSGLRVYYAGLVPTPALQYYIKNSDFDGGVMVTASHNPPEYCGIKVIMGDGVEAPRDVERELEEAFWDQRFRRVSWRGLGVGCRRIYDVNDFYVNGILELIDTERIRSSKFKVVVDPVNNTASLTSPKLLRKLGIKVFTVNADISHIPGRNPEPTPESLAETSAVVKAIKADFGIAHDGDGDRAIFIDDTGNVLPGDYSAVMLCRHILEHRGDRGPRRIVTAVSSSTLIEEILKDYNVEVIWTKVGSIVIARTMMRIGALAGFEENGGFMYPPHQYVRDGGMALALMLEFLSFERRKLSEIYMDMPKRYLVKTKVPLADRGKVSVIINELRQVFSGRRIIDIDGIKVISRDYWFLVRPSGTEPVVRIFVEGSTREVASKVLNELNNLVRRVLEDEVRSS